ncbi:MAG: hypothetical protein QXG25_02280, partial [Nitrososphaerota archaeon]
SGKAEAHLPQYPIPLPYLGDPHLGTPSIIPSASRSNKSSLVCHMLQIPTPPPIQVSGLFHRDSGVD